MLSRKKLKALLRYNPKTGVFTWRVFMNPAAIRGMAAGTVDKWGYRRIGIGRRFYYAHRLAWFYMTGRWPKKQVDHKNAVPGDDRWVNLRQSSHAQNQQNGHRPKHNSTGYKGVSKFMAGKKQKRLRYRAGIRTNGKYISLGLYDCPKEAHSAYIAEAKKRFGEFARAA